MNAKKTVGDKTEPCETPPLIGLGDAGTIRHGSNRSAINNDGSKG